MKVEEEDLSTVVTEGSPYPPVASVRSLHEHALSSYQLQGLEACLQREENALVPYCVHADAWRAVRVNLTVLSSPPGSGKTRIILALAMTPLPVDVWMDLELASAYVAEAHEGFVQETVRASDGGRPQMMPLTIVVVENHIVGQWAQEAAALGLTYGRHYETLAWADERQCEAIAQRCLRGELRILVTTQRGYACLPRRWVVQRLVLDEPECLLATKAGVGPFCLWRVFVTASPAEMRKVAKRGLSAAHVRYCKRARKGRDFDPVNAATVLIPAEYVQSTQALPPAQVEVVVTPPSASTRFVKDLVAARRPSGGLTAAQALDCDHAGDYNSLAAAYKAWLYDEGVGYPTCSYFWRALLAGAGAIEGELASRGPPAKNGRLNRALALAGSLKALAGAALGCGQDIDFRVKDVCVAEIAVNAGHGTKTIVMCRSGASRIASALSDRGVPCSQVVDDFDGVVRRFKASAGGVLLLNPDVHGRGANLQWADRLVIASAPADEETARQWVGRAQRPHRAGPLRVTFVLNENEAPEARGMLESAYGAQTSSWPVRLGNDA